MEVAETVVGDVFTPLNLTVLASVKFNPVSVIVAPVAAAVGVKDVMEGTA